MDAISSSMSMQQMQGSQNTDRSSQMESRAKSMGVPDEIIAQGKSAVKAWAQENGIMPSSMSKGSGNKNGMGTSDLMGQLNASGITQDSFLKALEEGHEATEKLFAENNFSLNVIA